MENKFSSFIKIWMIKETKSRPNPKIIGWKLISLISRSSMQMKYIIQPKNRSNSVGSRFLIAYIPTPSLFYKLM